MKVQVRLFANLREKIAGDPREHRGRSELELPDGATLQDLLDHYAITRRMSQMVLVDGEQMPRDSAERAKVALRDGCVVSIFPPLAGG